VPKINRWIRVALEVIGGLTVVAAVVGLLLWIFILEPMNHFTEGNCTDTNTRIIASPDGRKTIKFFYTTCRLADQNPVAHVYLSTGNSNAGYEYTSIATIENAAIGETSVAWSGSEEIVIDSPANADVEDVYAKILGVKVTLHSH